MPFVVPATASATTLGISADPDTGTGALTINVVAATGTFTRTTGNYLTAGFLPGQSITPSGFTNGGNNAAKIIKTVTSTIITVTDVTGLVDESGDNDERVVAAGIGAQTIGLDHFANLIVTASLTSMSAGTLDFFLQDSPDSLAGTWKSVVHFPQLAGAGAAVGYRFTLNADRTIVALEADGDAPSLAVNTVAPGPWNKYIRAVSKVGAGSNAATAGQTVVFTQWQSPS